MSVRVCVIGAGAAGLASLRAIQSSVLHNGSYIICYESAHVTGGQWSKYSPKPRPKKSPAQSNTNSIPASCMYKNLITNLPTCIMQFPDFEWQHEDSFVHHSEVANYLNKYCDHFGLQKYIKLGHRVDQLRRDDGCNKWIVTVAEDQSKTRTDEEFDYVFVCSGHFNTPRYIQIESLDAFPGVVIHSKFYDDPADFLDQTVLIIGKGQSGIDICSELIVFSREVYISSQSDKCFFHEHSKVTEVDLVTKYEDGFFRFQDGSQLDAVIDCVIFCTGYTYDHPFIDCDSCSLEISDGFISPLFKYSVHAEYPSLFFIGLNQRIPPFPFFHFQTAFCWSIVTSRGSSLPSDLLQVSNKETEQKLACSKKRHFFNLTTEDEDQLMKFFAKHAGIEGPPTWLAKTRKQVSELRLKEPLLYKKHRVTLTTDDDIETNLPSHYSNSSQ